MAKVKAEAAPTKHAGAKILVADDDPEILAMLALRLAKRGFQVMEAHDGNEALDQARRRRPDLVLLDVMMPGKNGWEVARALRQDPMTAPMKIVVVTAIGERINEMTSPMYGVDAYIDKPFEFTRLERVIEEALDAMQRGLAQEETMGARNEPFDSDGEKPAEEMTEPAVIVEAAPEETVLPMEQEAPPARAPRKAKPAPKAKKPAAKKAAPKKAAPKAKAKPAPKAKKAAPKKAAPKKAAPKKAAAKAKKAAPKKKPAPAPKKKAAPASKKKAAPGKRK